MASDFKFGEASRKYRGPEGDRRAMGRLRWGGQLWQKYIVPITIEIVSRRFTEAPRASTKVTGAGGKLPFNRKKP